MGQGIPPSPPQLLRSVVLAGPEGAAGEHASSTVAKARRIAGHDPDTFTQPRIRNPQHAQVMGNLNNIWDQAYHWWQTLPVGQKGGMALVGLVILLASGVGTRHENGR